MPAQPLDRFIAAQADRIDGALAELAAGSKRGHWMWFIFPQLIGLGRSETALYYGIAGPAEARTFIAHPLLGARYDECCRVLARWAGKRSAQDIFGQIDAMKLRSSLTLMELAGSPQRATLYASLLDGFFDGVRDDATRRLVGLAS